jgi:uncharacterized membrane protein YjjP (DUF1212 family)
LNPGPTPFQLSRHWCYNRKGSGQQMRCWEKVGFVPLVVIGYLLSIYKKKHLSLPFLNTMSARYPATISSVFCARTLRNWPSQTATGIIMAMCVLRNAHADLLIF